MDWTKLVNNDKMDQHICKIVSTHTPYGEVFGHEDAIAYIKELVDSDVSLSIEQAMAMALDL
jgi:hypothetical protein